MYLHIKKTDNESQLGEKRGIMFYSIILNRKIHQYSKLVENGSHIHRNAHDSNLGVTFSIIIHDQKISME